MIPNIEKAIPIFRVNKNANKAQTLDTIKDEMSDIKEGVGFLIIF